MRQGVATWPVVVDKVVLSREVVVALRILEVAVAHKLGLVYLDYRSQWLRKIAIVGRLQHHVVGVNVCYS